MAETTWALITGASSGIGLELAHCFARDGIPVVLVARRANRLKTLAQELKDRYGVDTRVIPQDLTEPDATAGLIQTIEEEGLTIEYLVNNAGIGSYGRFFETAWPELLKVIQLNIVALTELTYFFGRKMIERNSGRILNVASTAAYQPGPWMAVYFATKAYVLWLSEALDEELKGTNVRVTTLCPGATLTEFQERAQMQTSRFVKRGAFMTAEKVAQLGYEGMKRGKRVVITGFQNRLMVGTIRFLPRRLVTKIAGWLMAPTSR